MLPRCHVLLRGVPIFPPTVSCPSARTHALERNMPPAHGLPCSRSLVPSPSDMYPLCHFPSIVHFPFTGVPCFLESHVVVVVRTLPRRHNATQSVVTGQSPMTLERKIAMYYVPSIAPCSFPGLHTPSGGMHPSVRCHIPSIAYCPSGRLLALSCTIHHAPCTTPRAMPCPFHRPSSLRLASSSLVRRVLLRRLPLFL